MKMHLYFSIPIFVGSLALVVGGSVFFSRLMRGIGPHLPIPGHFLGLLVALGADSPEISSAIAAMLKGQRDVGVGVVFGSNLFNLAFLLGISAILAGRIRVRRAAVIFDGTVGALVTGVAVAMVLGFLSPLTAFALLLCTVTAYVTLLVSRRHSLELLPLPRFLKRFLLAAVSETKNDTGQGDASAEIDESVFKSARHGRPPTVQSLVWKTIAALVAIVAGSIGLLTSTTVLTVSWLPHTLLGPVVLAALTGIPNLYTAARLAERHRGAAVFIETMNSNTINLLVGLALPSLLFGNLMAHTNAVHVEIVWLPIMTIAVVSLIARNQGLNRKWGASIIAVYFAFIVVLVIVS